jgi:Ca2+-binding RTX toxin-like protein
LEGDDYLYGGSDADYLSGDSGNDNLYGGMGADILIGGVGNDFLSGDDGADTYILNKGDGKDEISNYDTDNSVDTVKFNNLASTEISAIFQQGNTGNLVLQYAGGQLTVDYFFSDANYRVNNFQFTDVTWTLANIAQLHNGSSYSESLTAFDGVANTINGLAGKDYITGGTGADNLNGGAGYDSLYGGNAADKLNGGTGNDFLQGDNGADTYIFSQLDGKDEILNYDSDSSIDTVKFIDMASVDITAVAKTSTYNLFIQYGVNSSLTIDNYFSGVDYVVNQFQFTDGITITNFLIGTTAANKLTGTNGNDLLIGLAGADTMTGGSGSDLYFVDSTGDKVVEAAGVAGNIDTVKSSVDYSLAVNIENLILTGTTAVNASGNDSANQLLGNSIGNLLNGGSGNDTINGGLGNDTLTGGLGNDVFQLTNLSTDTITDFTVGADSIQLSAAIFPQGAVVDASDFIAVANLSAAATSSASVIYNTTDGALYIDADGGSGAAAAVQIALLGTTTHPVLTNTNFVVI